MNACVHNRKRIAWLALNSLDARQAQDLHEHFNACPACRAYWLELCEVCQDHKRAAETLPEVTPRGSFHRQLVQRVQSAQLHPLSQGPEFSWVRRSWPAAWKIAIPIAAALALLLAIIQLQPIRSSGISDAHTAAPEVKTAAFSSHSQPTLSVYRAAADSSLEALDTLLNQQAIAAPAWSGETLTVSGAIRAILPD